MHCVPQNLHIILFYIVLLWLTHWGGVTHICVGKLTVIGWDNGLSPERRQAIISTSAGILLTGPLGTNFSEILIEIQTFSLKKICLKMLSAKCCSFRLSLNVLKNCSSCWFMSYIDGLVQERCNSSALAMELHLSCTNPSTYSSEFLHCHWTNHMIACKVTLTDMDITDQHYNITSFHFSLFITVMSHECPNISNHWQLSYLLNNLIRLTSKKTYKPCITGPM